MKNIIVLGFTIIVLVSCRNGETPKVIFPENETTETTELKKDSTLIEIADIPIHFENTNYLIHPIGQFSMYGSRGKDIYGSSSYGTRGFSISNFNRYEITGNLHNLMALTTKNIRIKSITFLKDIFESTKKQILIYRVLDKDTNQDNELDEMDI